MRFASLNFAVRNEIPLKEQATPSHTRPQQKAKASGDAEAGSSALIAARSFVEQ
jgi:hypothetical protein